MSEQKQAQQRITVSGVVGDTVKYSTTKLGQPYVSFEMAVQEGPRRGAKRTVYYTVNAFRQLAVNASQSIKPGDRLLVTGTIKEVLLKRPDHLVTKHAITAGHMGHDLFWGTSEFTRTETAASAADQTSGAQS
ncbi:single-stranded DNA-binding protein [Leucobacter ruminantium]|uniref:Single-stranded DNA-binding protein n=1 Tax=Leucobacter ruminantium TaxID=1289170 RepID=A0A939LWP2_9MICO|nr:single-stranded DNA-binding protein [Leucobacter ruminantium]MBO1806164.1 single-stranded DNA-binding protein [Leucobacter ruminantium]